MKMNFLLPPLMSAMLGISPAACQTKPLVHAVVDLGHQFTFYGDGRFHRQYLSDQKGVTSWGSLFNFDLSNGNLLVLLGCDEHLSAQRAVHRETHGGAVSPGGEFEFHRVAERL